MQVNCSINHTLNQSATNEELDMLVSNYFRPNQQEVIAAFVGRQAIKNSLKERER